MAYEELHRPTQDVYSIIGQLQAEKERKQVATGLDIVQGNKKKISKGCTKPVIILSVTVITLLAVIIILIISNVRLSKPCKLLNAYPDITISFNGGSCFLSCPDKWIHFQQSCYFFSNDRLNWSMSRESCKSSNADLVVINSKEEQDFLSKHYNETSWIGLTDQKKENNWKWVDGTEYKNKTSFWCTGEPNNLKTFNAEGENCVTLSGVVCQIGWNDDSCQAHHMRICEKQLCLVLT
ncbi:C-type lectin domain family 4 member E-like isoform X2 [Protopterus annectens]|uniref:C-type lectin domain family 4 member E-like isoform X2 n=1 Tax=Protopterus annectens TaxID=7888 RepID=UPI001CF961BD|nr:C-type lectin domain family 4 member E-like isoform X2 [Protopterus annectens]